MNQNGALDVESININDMASHGDCTFFALLAAIDFFKSAAMPVSSRDLTSDTPITLFPNPATDLLFIEGIQPDDRIELLTANGQKLISWRQGYGVSLDVSSYPDGMYFIKIRRDQHIEVLPLSIIRS